MVKKTFLAMLGIFISTILVAQAPLTTDQALFQVLDLSYPGLDKVRKSVEQKDFSKASEALLTYYRKRMNIVHPDINRADRQKALGKELSKQDRKLANDGYKHVFKCHKGYPPFDFGKDVDWHYWPVKDNEVRWQLHRMYWWIPMGKMYWSTGDEKWAKEWMWQLEDWIKDNPYEKKNVLGEGAPDASNNMHWAWRQLEASRRLQDQTTLFNYFIDSPSFTPEFLMTFLKNYYLHASHVMANFSDRGNHLLFEAQRMVTAGCFFPEFKDAKTWRNKGVSILKDQIAEQVYNDGLQFEFSPNYHIACIGIFYKALEVAKLNGFGHVFPPSYYHIVEKMITATYNFSFPDYTYPMFSDAKLASASSLIRNYKTWLSVFPGNEQIRFFATKGKKGEAPAYTSVGMTDGGFYAFRSGWDKEATCMVLKASKPAFWHSQPDNGTFDLWVKGRNFMPDAGCYVYGGDAEIMKQRNWFRQTKVHKTLTLNGENIKVDAKLKHWSTSANKDVLVYENPSYDNLTHQRTVFFLDKSFFVILDKAQGSATGKVALHYQLIEGDYKKNIRKHWMQTDFDDNNNLFIQVFAPQKVQMQKEEGWVSYHYKQKTQRPAYAFASKKKEDQSVSFVTFLVPCKNQKSAPKIKVKKIGAQVILFSLNGKEYSLKRP